MGSSEGRVSFGFDGFRFWVLSSVSFLGHTGSLSAISWCLSPSIGFSLSQVSQSQKRRKKNRKEGEERREMRKNNKGERIGSLLSSLISQFPHHSLFPFSHDRPLSETQTETGKRRARRKEKRKRREEEKRNEDETKLSNLN